MGETWSLPVQVTQLLVHLTCLELSVSAPLTQQLLHCSSDLPVKWRPLSKLVGAVLHQKRLSSEPCLKEGRVHKAHRGDIISICIHCERQPRPRESHNKQSKMAAHLPCDSIRQVTLVVACCNRYQTERAAFIVDYISSHACRLDLPLSLTAFSIRSSSAPSSNAPTHDRPYRFVSICFICIELTASETRWILGENTVLTEKELSYSVPWNQASASIFLTGWFSEMIGYILHSRPHRLRLSGCSSLGDAVVKHVQSWLTAQSVQWHWL